ncbi:MAG: glycosyltransferase, partial [Bacteroidetes bacterium]|nr:glycosyltransferase [Bacteroidota bacterium]
MKVSVITVNFNTHKHLQMLLESIYAYPPGFDFEIIIVDNNSPDRGIVELESRFRKVKFLFLEKNLGFGYGCNQGAKLSKGEYLAFINPDISFVGNSLETMAGFLDVNLNAACTTGLLMNYEKKLQYSFNDFPDFKWMAMEAFGTGAENKVNRMLERPEIKNGTPFEIDWAHGACLVVRRNIFF